MTEPDKLVFVVDDDAPSGNRSRISFTLLAYASRPSPRLRSSSAASVRMCPAA